MIIIGIDPGTTLIGYSILDCATRTPHLLHADLLPIAPLSAHDKLLHIHKETKKIIDHWQPHALSVEKLFFQKNAKTAMAVSEARGVILLTALLAGIKVYEYAPLTIKKVITGDGSADKMQIQKMVRMIIKEGENLPAQDDIFDSIASALCCLYQEGLKMKHK